MLSYLSTKGVTHYNLLMTAPRILSRATLNTKTLESLIRFLIYSTETLRESTCELTFVFDKVNWIRFYWNNVARLWSVSRHTKNGWEKLKTLATKELVKDVGKMEEYFSRIFAVQYRTVAGVDIYLNSAVHTRTPVDREYECNSSWFIVKFWRYF